MTRDADGVFTARATPARRARRQRLRLPAARRRRASRSGVAPPAARRARAVAHRRGRRVSPGPTPAGAASPRADLVVYELHVGTFSPEGTFAGVAARLPYLRDLGVTAVELMPVAAFPGDRNWGYDGVYLFAPHTAYGGPDGLQAARRRLPRARARADPRRRLQPPRAGGELPRRLRPVLHRPLPHAVGRRAQLRRPRQRRGPAFLRRQRAALADASTTSTGCASTRSRASTTSRRGRSCRRSPTRSTPRPRAWAAHAWLIAESDLNDPRVIRPKEVGGLGLDAQWSDDFHHALHAVVTGNRRGYFGDFGRVADVGKAITAGFVYDGQHAPHRRRRHGAPAAGDAGRSLRVVHPEPRPGRERLPGPAARRRWRDTRARRWRRRCCSRRRRCRCCSRARSTPRRRRSTTSPATAIPALVEAVRKGRHAEYLHLLEEGADMGAWADPQAEETFRAASCAGTSLDRAPHAEMLAFYRALIALRRRLAPLRNGRKDLTRVDSDEAGALADDPARRSEAAPRRSRAPTSATGRRASASADGRLAAGARDGAVSQRAGAPPAGGDDGRRCRPSTRGDLRTGPSP